MIIGLLVVLTLVLILPFVFKPIEHNLEYFLFVMGLTATVVSGSLSADLVTHVLTNKLLYFITFAVLSAGLIFFYTVNRIKQLVDAILLKIPLKVFVLIIVIFLGLVSSFITAIIASLVLVEILHALPIKHKTRVRLAIVSCFSIGLGAALTPIGEPLSTIVTSTLKADFGFLFGLLAAYIIPGCIIMGLLGMFIVQRDSLLEATSGSIPWNKANDKTDILSSTTDENSSESTMIIQEEVEIKKEENLSAVFIRALKIFVFVIALELLGAGFKPLINTYIIHLDSQILYWINITSSILDNATLAAAEISPAMGTEQIKAILMGLLISGGMLIPGNIPNIICAGKLNIKSGEWALFGFPLGLVLLLITAILLFVLKL